MDSLPSLSDISKNVSNPNSPLAKSLSILFEHSPVLISKLEPELTKSLPSAPLSSYSELIDRALDSITRWDIPTQLQFLSGHPRIGESKSLSDLSAKEQGAVSSDTPTPPEVLARLAHLNVCYETKYPGLRYITFVNGRTRQEIAEEMEDKLYIPHSLSPDIPLVSGISSIDVNGEEWESELQRATRDIGLIAKNRLRALKVE